jgi:hypothetical protein
MRLSVTSTASRVLAKNQRRAAAVPREHLAASQDIAKILLEGAREVMQQDIYNRPIPRTKSGKEKWQRDRTLINSERCVVRAGGDRLVFSNRAAKDGHLYAKDRYWLGTPKGRRIKSVGYVISTQWRQKARNRKRREIRRRHETMRVRIIKQPG